MEEGEEGGERDRWEGEKKEAKERGWRKRRKGGKARDGGIRKVGGGGEEEEEEEEGKRWEEGGGCSQPEFTLGLEETKN